MSKPWIPFWFESNRFFDWIKCPEDWVRLRQAYPEKSNRELLQAQETTYKGTRSEESRKNKPIYGFRIECDGEPLNAFFERHGMVILLDAFDQVIYNGDTLDVQKAGCHVVYELNGELMFEPYGKPERVRDYFSDDIHKVSR